MAKPTQPLPPVHKGQVDTAGLRKLLAEIQEHGQQIDIAIKSGALQHAHQSNLELCALADMLCSGTVRRAQVRYVFDGKLWADTLSQTQQGFQVVRMDMQRPPQSP